MSTMPNTLPYATNVVLLKKPHSQALFTLPEAYSQLTMLNETLRIFFNGMKLSAPEEYTWDPVAKEVHVGIDFDASNAVFSASFYFESLSANVEFINSEQLDSVDNTVFGIPVPPVGYRLMYGTLQFYINGVFIGDNYTLNSTKTGVSFGREFDPSERIELTYCRERIV